MAGYTGDMAGYTGDTFKKKYRYLYSVLKKVVSGQPYFRALLMVGITESDRARSLSIWLSIAMLLKPATVKAG